MGIARHASGSRAALAALASQVHPVFMLPPVAASWFGSTLAGEFDVALAALHATAVALAVYTAHVKDGYVDFYVRGEDDDHPLTRRGCRLALAGASVAFFAALGAIAVAVGPLAALLTLPTWLVAYHHAPQLDTNPVTTTTGYPLGVAVALAGGYYVQAAALGPVALGASAVLLVLLSGVKVVDDAQDYDYDRGAGKRTVAVVLDPSPAHRLAYGLMALALALVLALVLLGPFPPSSTLAVLAFAAVAAVAARAEPELATMLLVRAAYVFLAVLVAALWFHPLA